LVDGPTISEELDALTTVSLSETWSDVGLVEGAVQGCIR
jgi:hypothetical protein